MKLLLLLIVSMSIISCSSNRTLQGATNGVCTASSLKLDTFKPKTAEVVSLPSNPNKSDDDIIAEDGLYILKSSRVHIHDLSQPVPDEFETNGPEFLQMAIAFTQGFGNKPDENNVINFNASVNCLSGLMPDHAGKLNYVANVPTIVEVQNLGSKFVPKDIETVEFGYAKSKSIKITPSPIADKSSIDKLEDINPSDEEVITNLYKVSPTSEDYQLQSRVIQGDVTLTIVNTYTRCPAPELYSYNIEECWKHTVKLRGR